MANEPLEIERRFLIRMPDETVLTALGGVPGTISQTYLIAAEGVTARVRKRTENGVTRYYKTEKRRITGMTRVEVESELTKEGYIEGLRSADPTLRPIEKLRWRIPYGGKTLEVDVFPFWERQAILEIELEREDEAYAIPEEITVLREITMDRAYTNRSMAEKIPEEDR